MRAALLAWCQPGLAQTMIEAGATFRRDWRSGHPDPFPDEEDISYAGYEMVRARETTYDRFAQARRKLVDDFKRRIEAGDLVLTGLSLLPTPERSRAAVPAAWLKHLDFNWTANTVRFGPNVVISDVTVHRRIHTGTEMIAERGGQPRFPMAQMIEIAKSVPRAARNKVTASDLLREFKLRWPATPPPAHRTICDHVGKIYAAI